MRTTVDLHKLLQQHNRSDHTLFLDQRQVPAVSYAQLSQAAGRHKNTGELIARPANTHIVLHIFAHICFKGIGGFCLKILFL